MFYIGIWLLSGYISYHTMTYIWYCWTPIGCPQTCQHMMPIIQLEQLERLRSEDTPRRLMITHTIESYWIPSQKKTKSKLQIKIMRQNFEFLSFETDITRDTPSEVAWQDVQIWNGSDEYCWRYRADTILSTDGQMDRRTRWYQYTPISTSLKRGYN